MNIVHLIFHLGVCHPRLSSPRCGSPRHPSILDLTFFPAGTFLESALTAKFGHPSSLSLSTGSHLCPRSLDCARAGRHFCRPGSSHCGPCLRPLVENSHGRCVVKRRRAPHAAQFVKGSTLRRPRSRPPARASPAPRTTLALCSAAPTSSPTPPTTASSSVSLEPGKEPPGDKKLAHSAQMYHYQHQKQQMLSLEKDEPKIPDSGASTDEENEDGDFTVYECPGLAPTGEMEVKNPLFDDTPLYLHKFR
uniref:Neural proliferation, differentiation and control, 1b n=1 Tax=Scophthalmus maximus TaxID=52904 RepID=A0A8D3CYR5_SCOMX